MSKVLFVNGNVHGHINPTLPLVQELVCRGEEVCYFSTGDFREKIEKTGAEFMDYGDRLYRFLLGYRPKGRHPFFTLIEFLLAMDRMIIPLVLEKIGERRFDYLIHDAMFGGGTVLAEKLGLPAVCSCTSFAMAGLPVPEQMLQPGTHPQLDGILQEAQEAAKEWNTNAPGLMDIFFKKERLNIVFTSRLFQPEEEYFDQSFQFVGPSISERNDAADFPVELLDGRKVVYISMGTINNNCMAFYKNCMEAFGTENYNVILSVGNKTDIADLDPIPANFIVRNFVPQLEILERADAFISHGGLNSVSEAMYYGVPVVAIPLANDQPAVAGRLAALGAGLGLKMEEVTPQILRDSVRKIINDRNFKEASKRIGESFVRAGGYKAAANCIMDGQFIRIP